VAYAISKGGKRLEKSDLDDALTNKIMEDTIIDVKLAVLSWRGNEGFITPVMISQKEANCRPKRISTNCISINGNFSEGQSNLGGTKEDMLAAA
jgi:hypothetical protein